MESEISCVPILTQVRLMKKRLAKKCLDLFESIANRPDPEVAL
jgi:hypothetical protein